MVWMITGCVMFSILTSCLISGLTVLSVDGSNLKLYGMKVCVSINKGTPGQVEKLARERKFNRQRPSAVGFSDIYFMAIVKSK